MKTVLRILLGFTAAAVLVVLGLSAGWLVWGRQIWMPGQMWNAGDCAPGSRSLIAPSASMMGPGRGMGGYVLSCGSESPRAFRDEGETVSMSEAEQAIRSYLDRLGYDDLEIAELMEFEFNYYAIVHEHDTDIGAMELLVDKSSGAVVPEMGPNMMWNVRYGMHRRARYDGNAVSEEQAVAIAQRWLDEHRPGSTTEGHADPFYGYYTIHTLRDGETKGMLSVHGSTGQVWYHTWHGAFIQMTEAESHSP